MIFLKSINAILVKGSLPLDAVSFDKVVSKFKHTFIKFDTAYPYGDKHDEFKKIALKAYSNPNLAIAEVNINEYGDNENQDLAKRFSVSKEDYPQYRLFDSKLNFKIMQNTEKNWKEMDQILFLRENNVWVGLPFCTERLDQFAAIFMKEYNENTPNEDHLDEIIDGLDNFIENGGSPDSSTDVAKIYLTIMEKMQEKYIADGTKNWYKSEAIRVNNILSDKDKIKSINKNKITNMRARLNILYSFAQPVTITVKGNLEELKKGGNGVREEL